MFFSVKGGWGVGAIASEYGEMRYGLADLLIAPEDVGEALDIGESDDPLEMSVSMQSLKYGDDFGENDARLNTSESGDSGR